MTGPTARVLALLEVLQAGGTRTVGDLATRLGVDERTVRRYVTQLTDLGIPVQSVRGRYGGYRVASGYRMPPLMLTDDEAVAVLVGLIAGRRTGLVTTSVAAVESAKAKLQRVLPESLRRRLAALLESTDFTLGSRTVVEFETTVLLLLAEAARNRSPVGITYPDAAGQRSERTVHPYGIVAHSGRWYLAAAESTSAESTSGEATSGEVRTFRLDRIGTAQPRAGTFEVPDGLDPTEHVLSGLARAPHRHSVSLRVRGSSEQVRARLPAGLATVRDLPDGWTRVNLQAERLDWLPALLAGMGLPFVVEHPDALREPLRALARLLTAAAHGPVAQDAEQTADGRADRHPTA